MAEPLRLRAIILVILVGAFLRADAQQPVLAVQTALTLYNTRVASWTSPTTVRAAVAVLPLTSPLPSLGYRVCR